MTHDIDGKWHLCFAGLFDGLAVRKEAVSAEFHSELLCERFEHLLVCCIHFLGLESSVGGAVVEAIGDGFAVEGKFFA